MSTEVVKPFFPCKIITADSFCVSLTLGSLLQLDSSVDVFLQSLGLEKYLITFQAEEVDMTALVHMTDEDLKALGIPMVNSS
ncbi:hypothetical protein NC651_032972 [Populus alba x Populus x berolinensis]|nr:hypothetical protein NC651_032972 [Populus alba x Populus x berolinensis]